MSRRRGRKPQPPTHERRVELTHVPDTSATTDDPLSNKRRRKKYHETYEKISPPFNSSEVRDKPITWNEIGIIWKVGGVIVAFFITIVIPVVWFSSSLNTNVEILQVDVKEIKSKTVDLVSNSMNHSQRLDGLEKSVSEINRNLSHDNNKAHGVISPNTIKPTQ